MDLVGKILADRYEIREEVGKGGMARVYKAWCNLLNRYVAIKVLKEEFKDDKEFVHRFNVEAQAAACISNPHVVSIYDVGIENGLYYIVMEYIEGITLKEYIADRGSLPWREAASFAAQICEGLAAAHKANVVHRDIKPQNILMTPEGTLKVTDFGIARASSQATTMGGNAIGTVHYLSPEQARGGYTDQHTDIYSLGVVLYEMLTGRLPFLDESPVAVAIKHIQEPPRPLREWNKEIPEAMEKVTLRAMEKEQGARYASAEAFLKDINGVLKNPNGGVGASAMLEDEMGSTMKMGGIDDRTIERYEKERKRAQAAHGAGRSGRSGAPSARGGSEMRELDERRRKREQKKKEQRITWLAILAAVLVIALLGVGFRAMTGGFNFGLGGEKVEIPNLVNMELEKAQHQYKENFSIVKKSEQRSDKEAGIILEQTPQAGEKVQKRSDMIIYVVVSAGNNISTLESYVGMDSKAAQDGLTAAGFQFNVIEQTSDSTEKGKVFAQDPVAGSSIAQGGLVTLYVSKGSEENQPTASASATPEPTTSSKPDEGNSQTYTTPPTEKTAPPAKTPEPTKEVVAPGIGD